MFKNLTYEFIENKLPDKAEEIRYVVFTLEQGFKKEDDLDDIDDKAVHILVYDKNRGIATARMFLDDGSYHIGRLAILKEYRNQGLGSYILSLLETKAKERNITRIILGSQIDKKGFYLKNGYKEYGEVFLDANYPHIMMEKKVL